jgi:uncharacterized protein
MGNFFKALKKGIKAASSSMGPGCYRVEEKLVTCPHCSSKEFSEGTAQLNSVGMTFIGLDWADKSAHTLLCSKCGRVEWYMQKPERI